MDLSSPFLIAIEEWGKSATVTYLENGDLQLGGVMKSVLDLLVEKIGFSYKLVRSPEQYWGTKQPNGSFTGMFGQLQRREIDMVLGPSTIDYTREEISDFTFPFIYDHSRIVYKKTDDHYNFWGFLLPFQTETWLAILTIMAIFCIISSTIGGVSQKIHTTEKMPSLVLGSIFLIGSLTLQGISHKPVTHPMRVILLSWAIPALIIALCYETILTSMMSVPSQTIPINSLQDVVNTKLMPWRLEKGSFLLSYFENSNDELHKEIFKRKAGAYTDCFYNQSEISRGEFLAFCDGTTAELAIAQHFRETRKCDLYIGSEKLERMFQSIAVTPGHPILPSLNYWLIRFFEHGFIKKFIDRALNKAPCDQVKSSKITGKNSVSLKSVQGFFSVLFAGYITATFVFLMEHLYSLET